jgi:hypothetical protein
MSAKYVRLFSDPDGNSHFQDCQEDLTAAELAPGIPPVFLSSAVNANQASFFAAPRGWESTWHPSTSRNLFVVITGAWEITASDGEMRRFSSGAVVLVEDTSGKGHTSRVIGQEDSLLLLVQLK